MAHPYSLAPFFSRKGDTIEAIVLPHKVLKMEALSSAGGAQRAVAIAIGTNIVPSVGGDALLSIPVVRPTEGIAADEATVESLARKAEEAMAGSAMVIADFTEEATVTEATTKVLVKEREEIERAVDEAAAMVSETGEFGEVRAVASSTEAIMAFPTALDQQASAGATAPVADVSIEMAHTGEEDVVSISSGELSPPADSPAAHTTVEAGGRTPTITDVAGSSHMRGYRALVSSRIFPVEWPSTFFVCRDHANPSGQPLRGIDDPAEGRKWRTLATYMECTQEYESSIKRIMDKDIPSLINMSAVCFLGRFYLS